MDLRQLVAIEKEGGRNVDEDLAMNISKKRKFAGAQELMDDERIDDFGAGTIDISLVQNKRERMSEGDKARHDRKRAIGEANRQQKIEDTCNFCLKGSKIAKHLVIALGERTLLMLPQRGEIGFGHCFIVPLEHVSSVTAVDEDVYTEIKNFKKCVARMYATMKQEAIFLEMACDKRRHTYIECVPLPRETSMEAPIYFKKGLLDADEEWSQHKKVIDTAGKGIRRSVPKGFPYFNVEFGCSGGGFAHVVEDETKFPRNFGRDILLGMLSMEPERMHRQRRTHQDEVAVVSKFVEKFQPFDWTRELDGGDYK